MEECYEQFLTKNYGPNQNTVNTLSSLLLFLIAVAVFGLGNWVISIIMALIYLGLLIYSNNKFIEYEYELVCDELTITKILNKKKRKRIANIELKNIIEVEVDKKACKVIDTYIDVENKLNKKVLYVKEKNQIKAYKIAMDRKMLEICRRINPRVFNGI